MKTHRIALYPGDGIGPEVTDAAVTVLAAAENRPAPFTSTTSDSTGASRTSIGTAASRRKIF